MNNLSTYWDLEPKTRAALSESDVQRYVDAELMLKGVLKVEPLLTDPEPDMPVLAKTTHFKLQGFDAVFATHEQAQQFAALKPQSSDCRYIGGGYSESVKYLKRADDGDRQIVPIDLADADDVANAKAELERVAAIRQANEKKRQDHSKALKLQNDALEGLWADWHERRAEAARHRKLIDTYEAYCKTADGDTIVAARFLQKVFSVEQIKAAADWYATTLQTEFPVEDGIPDPGPSHPDAPEPAASKS